MSAEAWWEWLQSWWQPWWSPKPEDEVFVLVSPFPSRVRRLPRLMQAKRIATKPASYSLTTPATGWDLVVQELKQKFAK